MAKFYSFKSLKLVILLLIPLLQGCPAIMLAGAAAYVMKDDPEFQKGIKQAKKDFNKLFADLGLEQVFRAPNSSYVSYTKLDKRKVSLNGRERKYTKLINNASKIYGVPASRIAAVIRAESAFNPTAVSHAGAQGLMQLMPATARDLGVRNTMDPKQNIYGGTKYLRILYSQYRNWNLTHAAYNAGPGNVKKYNNRIPPFKETKNYVIKVNQYNDFYVKNTTVI